MNALILAAGYGTRLERDIKKDPRYAHLSGLPKPLVPVGNKALVQHWVDALKNCDKIQSIYLVTNECFYQLFCQAFESYGLPVENVINDGSSSNETRKGALRSIQIAVEAKNIQSSLMVIGGDTLFYEDFSIDRIISSYEEQKEGSLVLCYACNDVDVRKTGILEIDASRQVTGFLEKPHPQDTPSRLACPCFYVYSPSTLILLSEYVSNATTLQQVDAPGTFISWLYSRCPVYAHSISGRFDIGGLDSYKIAHQYFLGHNRQWMVVRHHPHSPQPEQLELFETDIPKISDGEFLVHVHYLSVDPYMRYLLNESSVSRASVGSLMQGTAVGVVIQSQHDVYRAGDTVQGRFGWQDFAVSNGENVRKIPPSWKPSHSLGVLGMPGAAAYYGFLEICEPKAGRTVLISSAAGCVGNLVGQIAKLMGCRVIGLTSSVEKAEFCLTTGFDGCLVYRGKSREELVSELHRIAPEGIDYYFDNTGGLCAEAAVLCLNHRARVAVCGQVTFHTLEQQELMPSVPLLLQVLAKEARIEGFHVSRWNDWSEAHAKIAEWIEQGKLQVREDIIMGLENAPEALIQLFRGENTGKRLVQLIS